MRRNEIYRKRKTTFLLIFALMSLIVTSHALNWVTKVNERSAEQSVMTQVAGPVKLMPVGAAVGIHIQTKGLLVLDTAKLKTGSDTYAEPCEGILKTGDYILKVNGRDMNTTDDMVAAIDASQGKDLDLEISRDHEISHKVVAPALVGTDIYKLGLWLRDDTQGIGTLSFVDENNRFAALGHGITDIDTGGVIEIRQGHLYPATIFDIVRGIDGQPGEMVGHISYGQGKSFGSIKINSTAGIYGVLQGDSVYAFKPENALETASKETVSLGEAQIMCQIDGVVECFDAQISGIDYNNNNKNKDFILEVTDARLVGATGGIIQGMSGSPVIQNHKIIGVVTHVFLNHSSKGYGIFIENMLSKLDTLQQ